MNTTSQTKKFREALEIEAPAYGVMLAAEALRQLSEYYELLNAWNSRLHLVAPASPRQFATRHVLESLFLLEYLPKGASIADVGSGAGLPIIPCMILRPDIRAVLIEASKKKAVFLREALKQTATPKQANVIAERFENIATPDAGFVTCRALERFDKMLPRLVEWAPLKSTLLLFGGGALGKRIEDSGLSRSAVLMPNSRGRFLFVVAKG
jgi:16S rRNA (guanine527-N7)-methyltransferase